MISIKAAKWCRAAAIAGMLGYAATAVAGGSGSGFIVGINSEAGSGKFQTNGGHPNAPACATTGRWAVDVTTPAGQAMWSTILTAYSQNRPVTVGGFGQCNVWPDSETVQWVQLP